MGPRTHAAVDSDCVSPFRGYSHFLEGVFPTERPILGRALLDPGSTFRPLLSPSALLWFVKHAISPTLAHEVPSIRSFRLEF